MAERSEPVSWRRLEGAIAATAKSLRQTYDAVLAETELTLPEATLVGYVVENGPVTQSQIARGLGASRAAIGLRVDALEGLGYVQRQTDPSDRRVWLISATGSGRDIAERALAIDEWFREAVRDGITPAERQAVVGVLLRIQANLGRMADAGPTIRADPRR